MCHGVCEVAGWVEARLLTGSLHLVCAFKPSHLDSLDIHLAGELGSSAMDGVIGARVIS